MMRWRLETDRCPSQPKRPPRKTARRQCQFRSRDQIRQQAEEARALDGLGQFALLLGRDGGDARGHDLAALGDVARQQPRVLVVDLRRIRARRTGRSCGGGRTDGGARRRRRRSSSELASLGGIFTARAARRRGAAAAVAAIAAVADDRRDRRGRRRRACAAWPRAVFQGFDANGHEAQDVFVDRALALGLGQGGRRSVDVDQGEMRLAVLLDPIGEGLDAPIFDLAEVPPRPVTVALNCSVRASACWAVRSWRAR